MLTAPTTPLSSPMTTAADPPGEGVDLRPASAYEAVTRQMVESLADDMKEIKSRLDTLFYTVIGAIILDMLTRWFGG